MSRQGSFRILLAGLLGMAAVSLEAFTVSSGGDTADYTTFEEAYAACQAGGTITLSEDVTFPSIFTLDKCVTIDLAEHTFKTASPEQFIRPTAAADGAVIKNGRIYSPDCCFGFRNAGPYTITVSNVRMEGTCVLFGEKAGDTTTLELTNGCVVTCTYLCSSHSDGNCRMNVRSGVIAPGTSLTDNTENPGAGTVLKVYGGAFKQNPSYYLAAGYVVDALEFVEQGIECHYRVSEVGASDTGVVSVSSTGGETRNYQTFEAAFAVCQAGDTLTLNQDCEVFSTFDVDRSIVIDLNGHQLKKETTAQLFNLKAGSTGLLVKNGTIKAGGTIFMYGGAQGLTQVQNCTLDGQFLTHGTCNLGENEIRLIDTKVICDYIESANTWPCHVVSGTSTLCARQSVRDLAVSSFNCTISSGRTTFDVTDNLADGCCQIVDPVEIDGIVYRFRVLPTSEAGARPAALVVSEDGSTTNEWGTLEEAMGACPEGDRIVLLQSRTFSGYLNIPRSLTLDLNGLTLRSPGDFIKLAPGVTLNVTGGGTLWSETGSIFILTGTGAPMVVNVENCTLLGTCPLYGESAGTLNLYAGTWVKGMSLLASSNGSAKMNIYGGCYYVGKLRDGNLETGTAIQIYGGNFNNNMAPEKAKVNLLAPGYRIFLDDLYLHGLHYRHHVYSPEETADWTVEAHYDGVFYTDMVQALNGASEFNGVVYLDADIARTIAVKDFGKATSATLDLNGHEIAAAGDLITMAPNLSLTVRNGTLRELGQNKSLFVVKNYSKLTVEKDVRIQGSDNGESCGFYMPGAHATVVLDGCEISTTRLISWGGTCSDSSVVVKGDGLNLCPKELIWPGTSPGANTSLVIRGGRWHTDPSDFVPVGECVRLFTQGASPCPWRVCDWADVCANGLTFNVDETGLAVAQGTVDAPTEPIVVKLEGGLYPSGRRHPFVDFSELFVRGGGVLSFTKAADAPKDLLVEFDDSSRLWIWQVKGTTIFVR